MNWMDKLRKAVPDVEFGKFVSANRTSNEHPRVIVAKSIQNTLKYIADNNFKVQKRSTLEAPELCYKEINGKCEIKLKYAREIIELSPDGTKTITCNKNALQAALETLKEIVTEGEFDTKLEEIRSARAATLRGARNKKNKSQASSNSANGKAIGAKKAA
jgi:hypothetical protein